MTNKLIIKPRIRVTKNAAKTRDYELLSFALASLAASAEEERQANEKKNQIKVGCLSFLFCRSNFGNFLECF